jgi:A/G-specific adenine glycosylase
MLQQTQASRVAEAFPRFLARFPTVGHLAGASRAEVVRAWAGLGYHRRAAALHDTARALVRDHGGVVPSDPAALRRLAGIGPYTAAAVASIAYGVPVAAVDTNVRKVVARATFGAERDEVAEADVAREATVWLDRRRPGEWNQAMMTLGRSICLTTPRCGRCPLAGTCRFLADGRTGRASVRAQPAFEGSMRQLRGGVLGALRDTGATTLGRLAASLGQPRDRVAEAVAGLVRDGLAAAGPAALRGEASGRVRLPVG